MRLFDEKENLFIIVHAGRFIHRICMSDGVVDFGKYKNRHELRDGFFRAVIEKKQIGEISPGTPLMGKDFLGALEKKLNGDYTTTNLDTWLGFTKHQDGIVISFDGVEIGYFNSNKAKDRQNLIMLVQELYNIALDDSEEGAVVDAKMETITELVKLKLSTFVTERDMEIVHKTKGKPGDSSKKEEKEMKSEYNKSKRAQAEVNKAGEKTVLAQEKYVVERAKSGMITLLGAGLSVDQAIFEANKAIYEKLIKDATEGKVGREGRNLVALFEGDLIRDLAATYVRMEEMKLTSREKQVEFDKQALRLIENFGLEKKGGFFGMGKSVLKDPRFERAIAEHKLGRDIDRRLSEDKDIWKRLEKTARGSQQKNIVALRKARANAGGIGSQQAIEEAYRFLTDHAGTIINPYEELKKYGYDGPTSYARENIEDPLYPEDRGVTYSVSTNGGQLVAHKVIDLTQASVEELVAYYIDAKNAALSSPSGGAIRGYPEAKKGGYAIVNNVFMNPANAHNVYQKLGGAGGVAQGKEEFLTILKHLFFNDKKTQQAIVSKYRNRKNRRDYQLGKDPTDPFHFDFSAQEMSEEMLVVLAFTQTLQEKLGDEMETFKSGSSNRAQMTMTYGMQVIEFRKQIGMAVPEAANYVKSNVDQVDRSKDTPSTATGNGLTRSGGFVDHLTMSGAGALSRNGMPGLAKVVVGAGEVVKVGLNVVEKGAMIVAGRRGIKAIRNAGKELLKGEFANAGTALRDGFMGKKEKEDDNMFKRTGGVLQPLVLAGALQAADGRLFGGSSAIGDFFVNAGSMLGIPAAQRAKERREQVNAMHDVTTGVQKLTENTIGTITLNELAQVVKPQGQGIVVDFDIVTAEKKQQWKIDKFTKRDLDLIEVGIARYLMDEHGMTSATLAILVAKYQSSGVTLNNLLTRYNEHKEPLDTIRSAINDKTILDDDTYHLLRYAENTEYETKLKHLVFVAQQLKKLGDVASGQLLSRYATSVGGFMSATFNGNVFTHKEMLSNVETLRDKNGKNVIERAKNDFFKKVVDLPYDATKSLGQDDRLEKLLNGYFSVLATAFDHRRINGTRQTLGTPALSSGWSYDHAEYATTMAGFFHDPAIVDGTLISTPTLGGVSTSGSLVGDHVTPNDVKTGVGTWNNPTDLLSQDRSTIAQITP